MSKKVEIDYYVVVTFDITVGDKSGIYSEASDLLGKKGLKKEVSGNDLPENVYYGVRRCEVTYEGDTLTQADIKARGDILTTAYYKILKDLFETKKIKYKIFISASRKSTSAIRYTITNK